MNENTKDTVLNAVKNTFKTGQSAVLSEIVKKPDFAFLDLSDSSLILVEFCMAGEESTGVEVEFEDLADYPTFLTFTAWVSQQIAET